MSHVRRWGRRALALTLGLALAALVAEFAYRATRLSALSPTTNPSYVLHDDELGWRYLPRAHARHTSREFDVEVAINARGFRGPDWFEGKRGRRVLVLGDSYAFGWGVRWEETFSARLQAGHPDWEVLDAAVSGYATDQELLLLRRLLPDVRPDVVVCVFCENDLWESSTDVAYGKAKPRFLERGGELQLTNVPVPSSWIERTSALWRALVKQRWEAGFLARARDEEAEWRLVRRLYRALRDELAGVPLVIVSDADRLVNLAREEQGIRHLDTRPALGASGRPTSFPVDGHWNAHGHELVFQALERELVELGGRSR